MTSVTFEAVDLASSSPEIHSVDSELLRTATGDEGGGSCTRSFAVTVSGRLSVERDVDDPTPLLFLVRFLVNGDRLDWGWVASPKGGYGRQRKFAVGEQSALEVWGLDGPPPGGELEITPMDAAGNLGRPVRIPNPSRSIDERYDPAWQQRR